MHPNIIDIYTMTTHALLFGCNPDPMVRNGGVHRIATYLRQHEWDVEVCDFTGFWPLKELKEFVRSRVTASTRFFGFGVFFSFGWAPHLNQFTAWLKKTWPDIPIVIGGQSVGQVLAQNIDYWVDSYGEIAMLELARSFVNNTSSSLMYDFSQMGKRRLIRSIHSYPAFPMDDYGVYWESRDFVQPWEWQNIELSRGCKFSCAYCNYPILNVKGDNSRSAVSFERQLKYNFDNFGVSRYWSADETNNDRVEKIRKFADVVDKLTFEPFFTGFIRLDLITSHPEMTEEMARMRFGGHFYGIESFNHASAKAVGKGLHPDRTKQTLLDIRAGFQNHNRFYRGSVALIVGLPFETRDSMASTQQWLLDNWSDQSIQAYPFELEDADNATDNTNLSKMSKDMQKYGLRRMSKDQELLGYEKFFYNWRQVGYTPEPNVVAWEHDTMNVFEAHDISLPLQNLSITTFKDGNFNLHRNDYSHQQKFPMEYSRNLSTSDIIIDKNITTAFVKQYVNCKLNWRETASSGSRSPSSKLVRST
jgi:hypothetical protein